MDKNVHKSREPPAEIGMVGISAFYYKISIIIATLHESHV